MSDISTILNKLARDNINSVGVPTLDDLWPSIEGVFSRRVSHDAYEHFITLFSNQKLDPDEQLRTFLTIKSTALTNFQDNFRVRYSPDTEVATCTIQNGEHAPSIEISMPLNERDYHFERLNFALDEWLKATPVGEDRNEAAMIIRQCFNRNSHFINISNQNLSSLPTYWSGNLRSLDVSNNQLTNLPTLPDSLTEANISNNRFTELPKFPDSLTKLDATNNQLKNIKSFPEDLQILNVANNKLKNMPKFPYYLTHLDASHNQLTSLPRLTHVMKEVNVANNQLTGLLTEGAPLEKLDISHNQFKKHPYQPPGLRGESSGLISEGNPISP